MDYSNMDRVTAEQYINSNDPFIRRTCCEVLHVDYLRVRSKQWDYRYWRNFDGEHLNMTDIYGYINQR